MSNERSRRIREFNFDHLVEGLVAALVNKPPDHGAVSS